MKNILVCSLLAVILLSSASIGQDNTSPQWKTRIGIGIGYEPFKIFGTSSSTLLVNSQAPVSLYIPIRTSNALTIEPEFGFFTYSSESGSGSSAYNSSASSIRLAAGVLATVASNANTRLYAGPRIGIFLVKQKYTSGYPSSTNEMSETDFTIGGSAGGEYFFVENMSLGGEAQVNYYSFGEPSYTPSSSSSSGLSRSMFSSNVVFFLRWYF